MKGHLMKGHLMKRHLMKRHLMRGQFVRWGAAALVLGAGGGVVWKLLARPGIVTVTSQGAMTTEAEALHQFGNVMLFLGVGAVICLTWAGALAVRGADRGWKLVPFVTVMSLAAALVARATGLALSPDKVVVPQAARVGDTILGILTMDAWSAVVAWAVFGVAGVLLATSLQAAPQPDEQVAEPQ
jgi:hypothetical protein